MSDLKIFSGSANRPLAKEICAQLGIALGETEIVRFADQEVRVTIGENVRGQDVFVVQPTCTPANEHLMELLIMLDALKRASAREINAVIPYYGYARQDRKDESRAPITAKLVADLLHAAGATRVISMDLHAGQIQGFFNVPFDHLFAKPVLLKDMKERFGDDEVVLVSPDAGGVERARAFAKRLNALIAIIDKRRTAPNVAMVMHVIGEVRGKRCVILDDLIDTAGTLCEAIRALFDAGAAEVSAYATHPVLSGPAVERLAQSRLKQLVVTNTIPLRPEAQALDIVRQLSVAPTIAAAIRRVHGHESLSALFD
ncbi:MAG: ribose-phosphate pyrophosphokinase [Deltaproteobacteria bacterium]|nr:ribose-phosphate pyrophosphokinase [Deltaproteobacteria bacterium]